MRAHGRSFLAWGRLFAAAIALVASLATALAHGPPRNKGPIIKADPKLDEKTVIAPSRIPKAGMGLYARVAIAKGETIGELGGELVEFPDLDNPSPYLAGLPDCAFSQVPPYQYIDSKDHGGNVSRANFAPRKINGVETDFQNAGIERICNSPWVIWVAIKDIAPGEEILLSYGPNYNYERFMFLPEVRDYFCGLLRMDCRTLYQFDY